MFEGLKPVNDNEKIDDSEQKLKTDVLKVLKSIDVSLEGHDRWTALIEEANLISKDLRDKIKSDKLAEGEHQERYRVVEELCRVVTIEKTNAQQKELQQKYPTAASIAE